MVALDSRFVRSTAFVLQGTPPKQFRNHSLAECRGLQSLWIEAIIFFPLGALCLGSKVEQVAQAQEAFSKLGFENFCKREDDGWVLLTASKMAETK